ncbi:hypothetical protein QR680_000522 [Steinernema hermaphroditum]|uniref:Uncharacterized protein n=1 Tax=Steinernema hermaphroditum TaxID=289476 RepID=A0AA39GWE4_9BILA|nr:hypothetical protein QR680_000522 [Steinernema hermaphroditum]
MTLYWDTELNVIDCKSTSIFKTADDCDIFNRLIPPFFLLIFAIAFCTLVYVYRKNPANDAEEAHEL